MPPCKLATDPLPLEIYLFYDGPPDYDPTKIFSGKINSSQDLPSLISWC